MKKLLFILPVVALFAASHALAATVGVLTPVVRPGDTFIANFDEQPVSVTLGGKAVAVFPYRSSWRAVAAVPLSTKTGSQQLVAQFKNITVKKTVSVVARKSNIIVLPVPEKLHESPQELVQSLASTNQDIGALAKAVTPVTRFSSPFALPLADNRTISSSYDEIRITGSASSPQAERITHLGTDFVMPKGSKVAAINSGVVAKAYADPTYGNSVIIDHGQGIYTLYLHLDKLLTTTGATVNKGAVIGTLGETGLASAPHLHLSVKINGVSVDPLQFISVFK